MISVQLGLERGEEEVKWALCSSRVSGRGLVATRDISQGELILQESLALAGPKVESESKYR